LVPLVYLISSVYSVYFLCSVYLVYLVYSVYSVYSVCLLFFVYGRLPEGFGLPGGSLPPTSVGFGLASAEQALPSSKS